MTCWKIQRRYCCLLLIQDFDIYYGFSLSFVDPGLGGGGGSGGGRGAPACLLLIKNAHDPTSYDQAFTDVFPNIPSSRGGRASPLPHPDPGSPS
jgi:hypothetical protein